MELTLVKTKTYQLEPYGYFNLKWKIRGQAKPNQILIDDLDMFHGESMPLSVEQDKEVVKMMKKHKTEILWDGNYNYYTRTGSGFTRVWHKKFKEYNENIGGFRDAIDSMYE